MTSSDQNPADLFIAVQLCREVPSHVEPDMIVARNCMVDVTSLATSHQRRAAQLFDSSSWKTTLSYVPLLEAVTSERKIYDGRIRGVDVSGEFLRSILGFGAAKGPATVRFHEFIGSLGSKISGAVDPAGKPFHFAASTVFIDAVQDGRTWKITPRLKMYFCDFTARDKNALIEWSEQDLQYTELVATWEFDRYKRDKTRFDELIAATRPARIDQTEIFFCDALS